MRGSSAHKIVNPLTGRPIQVGGKVHRSLLQKQRGGFDDEMDQQFYQVRAEVVLNDSYTTGDIYNYVMNRLESCGAPIDGLELTRSGRSRKVEIILGNLATHPSEDLDQEIYNCIHQLGEVPLYIVEEQVNF